MTTLLRDVETLMVKLVYMIRFVLFQLSYPFPDYLLIGCKLSHIRYEDNSLTESAKPAPTIAGVKSQEQSL